MIREIYEEIKQQKEVRQNLIQLKALLKEGFNKDALLYHISGDYKIFQILLHDEDPKIRKNTALIMGELGVAEFLPLLYEGYEKEDKLFVKSSYLTAMKNMDYEHLLPALQERLDYLSNILVEESDKKHRNEERKIVTDLILKKKGYSSHKFTGYQIPSELILLTNRNYKNITLDALTGHQAKEFNAGIRVKTKNLKEILSIRTYSELLFVPDCCKTVSGDSVAIGKALAEGGLLSFIEERHGGEAPYYFRIEFKGKLELDKKSAFVKKIGFEIENHTGRQLINTASDYEIELRLIENKEGSYNVLLKFYTLKDDRFSYRKESVASSIAPVNAALIAALAKDYLQEGGQVLDPFCGVGTMLIERQRLVPSKTMYGLDIFKEALEKAKINADEANLRIFFINRDFFDFKHEYLFDEIFTNMPRAMGHVKEDEIYSLYQRFFRKAHEHMEQGGIMVLYSHNRDFVKRLMNPAIYRMEEEFELSKKEGAYLFIIRVK